MASRVVGRGESAAQRAVERRLAHQPSRPHDLAALDDDVFGRPLHGLDDWTLRINDDDGRLRQETLRHERAAPARVAAACAENQISRRTIVELVSTPSLAVGPAEAQGHEAALAALVAAVLVGLLLEAEAFVEPLRPVAP